MWYVLVQGADIVLTDVDGKTAVHWTANNPDDSTIKTLLVSDRIRERGVPLATGFHTGLLAGGGNRFSRNIRGF